MRTSKAVLVEPFWMMQPLLAVLAGSSETSTDELTVLKTVMSEENEMPSTSPTTLVEPAEVRFASTVVDPAPAAAVEMTYHGATLVEPAPCATAPKVFALEPGPRTTPDETVTAVVGLPTVTVCCDESDTLVVGLLTVTLVVGFPTVTVCCEDRLTEVVGFEMVTAVVGFATDTEPSTLTAVVGLSTVKRPTSRVDPAEVSVALASTVVEPAPPLAVE